MLGLAKSSLTGLVDRTERNGLVQRKPDPDDSRAVRVALTRRGAKLAERVLRRDLPAHRGTDRGVRPSGARHARRPARPRRDGQQGSRRLHGTRPPRADREKELQFVLRTNMVRSTNSIPFLWERDNMSRTVAVIGGGYGGSAVAKALDPEADVVLIDPRDAFVNAAGVAAGADPARLGGQHVLPLRHAAHARHGGARPRGLGRPRRRHPGLRSARRGGLPGPGHRLQLRLPGQAQRRLHRRGAGRPAPDPQGTGRRRAGADRSAPGRSAWNWPGRSRRSGRTST